MNDIRLCDSHCHLDFAEFDSIRTQVLEGCVKIGVEAIVIPGVVAQQWPKILQLCRRQSQARSPLLSAALGLHPCFVDRHGADDLQELERLVSLSRVEPRRSQRVVAIGEIGLDFWRPDSDRQEQTELFVAQLALAKRFDLPVLLHVRKAHDEVLKQLRLSSLAAGGIVHAFSGSLQQAEQYIALGFKLGVGGAVTYPRATRLRSTLKQLGAAHWVLETDAPDMPMSGRQGQLNRPDYMLQVLGVVAELLQLPAPELARQLWLNTERVLGPLDRPDGG